MGFKYEDIEENFAKSIVFVEKEIGYPICEEYLLLKFFTQLEYLIYFKKEEEKASKRAFKARRSKGS